MNFLKKQINFIIEKKNKLVSFIKNKTKTFLFIVLVPILFIMGFFVPIKVTYYTTLICASLWFATFHFKEYIKYQHENTFVIIDTFYYKSWLLNISFIYSIFYVYYIYMCLLALQFL